jgi:uncharacterized integral membrane protein
LRKINKTMISLYFDPGTGALIVQFLAAAVAGVLLFYRTVLHKIKSVFGIKEKMQDDFMNDDDTKEDRE